MNNLLGNLALAILPWLSSLALATSFAPSAEYPEEALAKCIEGEVIVKLIVSEDGTATNIEVLRATPEGIFEEPTLKVLEYWRFNDEPGTVKEQTIEWRIEDREHCNS